MLLLHFRRVVFIVLNYSKKIKRNIQEREKQLKKHKTVSEETIAGQESK